MLGVAILEKLSAGLEAGLDSGVRAISTVTYISVRTNSVLGSLGCIPQIFRTLSLKTTNAKAIISHQEAGSMTFACSPDANAN